MSYSCQHPKSARNNENFYLLYILIKRRACWNDWATGTFLVKSLNKWIFCHWPYWSGFGAIFLFQLVVNSSSPLLCPQALNLVSSHICRPLSQFYVCEIPQSWVSVPCNLLNCCHIFLLPAICILLTVLTVSAWQETKLFLRATIWPQLTVVFFKLSCLLKLFLDQTYSWDQIRHQQLLVSMSELVSHPPGSGYASDFQPPWCPIVSISRTPQVSASIEKLRLICSCTQLWFVLRYKEETDFEKAS